MVKQGILKKIKPVINAVKDIGRGKFNLFFVTVLISSSMWLLVKLSKEYNTEISFKLRYKNVPSNLISVNDSISQKVTLKVRASGFKILNYRIIDRVLDFNIREILKENYAPSEKIYWEPSKSFFNSNEILNDIYVYDVVYPEIIYFNNIKLKKTKKVPIKFNSDIKLLPGYTLKNPISMSPDSVEIEGSYEDVDNVNVIETRFVKLNDVEESTSFDVDLNLPNNIKSTLGNVDVDISVEELIEKKLSVKIVPKNFDVENYVVKIIPEYVDVVINIGESKYNLVDSTILEAYIDLKDVSHDNETFVSLKINIASKFNSLDVTGAKIFPEIAEYILKKK